MKLSFSELPVFQEGTDRLNVVVETPKGSRNKYKYDPEHGLFTLGKLLPAGFVFPFDFGFVPSTEGEDGDPLDVLLLLEEPVFCGCLVTTRLLGVIEAEQTERGDTFRNDRLIGVPETDQLPARFHSLDEVDPDVFRQIEQFFIHYNQTQGKKFVPLRRSGPTAARELVEHHIAEHV